MCFLCARFSQGELGGFWAREVERAPRKSGDEGSAGWGRLIAFPALVHFVCLSEALLISMSKPAVTWQSIVGWVQRTGWGMSEEVKMLRRSQALQLAAAHGDLDRLEAREESWILASPWPSAGQRTFGRRAQMQAREP